MCYIPYQPVRPVEDRPLWSSWMWPEVGPDRLEETQDGGQCTQNGVRVVLLRPFL